MCETRTRSKYWAIAALRLGDAHPIVVEDNQHLAFEHACVIEPFHCDAVDDGCVADECHYTPPIRVRFWVVGLLGDLIASSHSYSG